MNPLINYLSHIYPLKPEAIEDLNERLKPATFSKGEVILNSGQVCNSIYFLLKGFAECYYQTQGKTATSWFWKEGDFLTLMTSFITRKPAIHEVKAVEDCNLLELSYLDLQSMYQQHLEFNIIGRKIAEAYCVKIGELGPSFRNMRARDRYENLLAEHPEIFQRTSLSSIASYLGMTQETLSRLRKP